MGASLRRALTICDVQTDPSSAANALLRRAVVGVPVLLLHLMLLWLLTQSRPQRSGLNGAQATQPMLLRWIEPAVTALPQILRNQEPTQAASQTPHQVRLAITKAATNTAPPTPWPQTTGTSPPADAAEISPEAAAANPSPPPPAPLDLRLPRGTAVAPPAQRPSSLATQDARANSARLSFGEKLADAMGSDDRLTEEDWGDGRIRIRRGADCVIAQESRAGQLDPMGQSTRPAPRGVKPCK